VFLCELELNNRLVEFPVAVDDDIEGMEMEDNGDGDGVGGAELDWLDNAPYNIIRSCRSCSEQQMKHACRGGSGERVEKKHSIKTDTRLVSDERGDT
jgi:hypothetical protein